MQASHKPLVMAGARLAKTGDSHGLGVGMRRGLPFFPKLRVVTNHEFSIEKLGQGDQSPDRCNRVLRRMRIAGWHCRIQIGAAQQCVAGQNDRSIRR